MSVDGYERKVVGTAVGNYLEGVTREVIGAMIEVHKALGPGLLESAYELCLCRELELRGIPFERQRPIAVQYKGELVDCGYRLDLVVRESVVVELKSVDTLLSIHKAQVISYLRLTKLPLGLLVNFNVEMLHHGIRRLWRDRRKCMVPGCPVARPTPQRGTRKGHSREALTREREKESREEKAHKREGGRERDREGLPQRALRAPRSTLPGLRFRGATRLP